MTDGVPGQPGLRMKAASTGRSTAEMSAELERLIDDAEAGGYEALVYLVRMALYEARRLERAQTETSGGGL